MFEQRQIGNLKCSFAAFLNSPCFRCDSDVLVDLALPHEVEVELTIVSQSDQLRFLLIDKEIAVIKLVGLGGCDWGAVDVCEDRVVDLVTLAFHIEHEWAGLALHVANQIVVVGQLELRLEYDLNGYL